MRIAEIMRESIELRLPRIETLASILNVSERRAIYLMRQVRLRGLMLETSEHRHCIGIVHYGKPNEFRFAICEVCLTRWPCAAYHEELAQLLSTLPAEATTVPKESDDD